ncbi:serine/threonine-protein kinase [Streptomyces barkulensis]|uniref:serine/threonine-protein kinase n=1 Tax=Streptomyces barkulensis TaxID=1257026 RepID=UPI000C6DB864|nr:serine/threonine-protein kinase [Streptomyces barkulensis]
MSDVDGRGKKAGRLLGGRYRLGDVLGRGGMGTVWRAEDEVLGRTVAVKELRFPSSIDEEEKRRLITRTLREAKAIARIRSNSAVTVYDVVDEDDRPWIVMELIDGRSLADVLREDGPLEPRRAAEVGLAILDVLRAAHREGILHRDVKPSNVLIADEDGRVVLTDFGIAQIEGDPSLTSTGMLVGAPSYIAPERARGQRPGPPSDLWSLGGLLYAAVEGHPPYDKGSAIATLTAVMTEPLEPPKRAGALEAVIHGLLDKDADKRLDEPGARALLERAARGPRAGDEKEKKKEEPEGTRTTVLPVAEAGAADAGGPAATAATAGAGGERLRGALRSVRAASAASAGRGEEGKAGEAGEKTGGKGAAGAPGAAGGAAATTAVPAGVARAARTARQPAGLAVVAVVVLALLGTVLAFAFAGDDEEAGGRAGTGTSAAPTDGQDADGDGRDDKDGGPGASSAEPSTEPSTEPSADEDGREGREDGEDGGKGGQGGEGLPEGYETVTDDRFHFSMAMPEGYERTRIAGKNSGGEYTPPGGGYPKIQVDFNGSPGDSAAGAWRSLEPAVRGDSTGYSRVDIEPVKWRDYPTVADWTFERLESGKRVRVLNRGFRVDDTHGYAIMITCEVDRWDGEKCRTARETAFRTFRPRD